MARPSGTLPAVPRITHLRVQNYRVLRDVTLEKLTPLTVFLGPNGSGKSTLFDVFAFLSECFTDGLRKAWDRRGRFKELRSRDADGPIVIELKYKEAPTFPVITYHLAIGENAKGPFVAEEWLRWSRKGGGKPFKFLDFQNGAGSVISGEMPDAEDYRIQEELSSPEMLAVNSLGQFAKHPRVSALRRFISSWYLSYLSVQDARHSPEAGPLERLSASGDNLANVIQYLQEQYPERLQEIFEKMKQRIPRLERVESDVMPDGRLLLQVKDAPFSRPILAKFASDGTLKMLAYLTILCDPNPPLLVGIEEPENLLHPRLLPILAEECRMATAQSQLLVTTHSPFFVNGLRPDELWALFRDESGYASVKRASEMRGVQEQVQAGSMLGHLWSTGYFDVGDPLTNAGGPRPR